MDLKNETKNQHFLSQTEQRLNAANPDAIDKKNLRIYQFDLIDREAHEVKLHHEKGVTISNTLSLHDLFSFDVLNRKPDRYNFEKLFHQYEADTESRTLELIRKLDIPGADIGPEIVNLFAAKYLNFVRNPYSVKKILNTFPSLIGMQPTDPIHLANFNRVLAGRKPQQRYLCEKLDISEAEYVTWLAVIFLLLTPLAKGHGNIINKMIEGLFESRELYLMVFIHTYDEHSCLLSDRGFSTPADEDECLAFDFNLHSKGFIRYTFVEVDSKVPAWMSKDQVDVFKETKRIEARHIRNDLEALKIYNRHVAYQCHSQVFCSDLECYGLVD
jgi:hypothetical protein